MSVLAWILVGMIVLQVVGLLMTIASIGKPRKPLDSQYACVHVVVAASFICLYIALIRNLR